MIKSEVAGDTELHENLEEEPIAETQILVDNLKFEPHPGEFLTRFFLYDGNRIIEIRRLSKTLAMLQILRIAAAKRVIQATKPPKKEKMNMSQFRIHLSKRTKVNTEWMTKKKTDKFNEFFFWIFFFSLKSTETH